MELVELADHHGGHDKSRHNRKPRDCGNRAADGVAHPSLAAVLFLQYLSNLLTRLTVVSKCMSTRFFGVGESIYKLAWCATCWRSERPNVPLSGA